MDDKITIALISGSAALLGAAISAFVAYFVAHEKTKQLEHTHIRELQREHLNNARQHLESIYIPLGKALTLLDDRFFTFQSLSNLDDEADQNNEFALEQFVKAVRDFQELIKALREQGAEVFMIPELDQTLGSFVSFLRESLGADSPVVKVVVSVKFNTLGLSTLTERSMQISGRHAGKIRARFSIYGFPVGITYAANEVLAAPLVSKEFVDQVSSTLPVLKTLITR